MKNIWLQLLVILVTVAVMGKLLERPQIKLTNQLREEGLISDKLSQDDQIKIGQTGYAVALGGLRSLVAAGMNLQATNAFSDQDWVEVEELYNIMVVLQPKNSFYWKNAGWHMGYNAYHDFEYKYGLTRSERGLKKRAYHRKGEDFFLRATKENPDDISLWSELGELFSNNHQPYDFPKAAAYYKRATECSDVTDRNLRRYFYVLARVKGSEKEAYELGKKLINRGDNRDKPSMRSIHFVNAIIHDPSLVDSEELMQEAFLGNKSLAYVDLANYWLRSQSEPFPTDNLREVISRLATELNVADHLNPLVNPKMDRLNTIE